MSLDTTEARHTRYRSEYINQPEEELSRPYFREAPRLYVHAPRTYQSPAEYAEAFHRMDTPPGLPHVLMGLGVLVLVAAIAMVLL